LIQLWVCASLQPGTAKPFGAVAGWGALALRAGDLARCTGAAFAETDRLINTPMARTNRIAFAPPRETSRNQCEAFPAGYQCVAAIKSAASHTDAKKRARRPRLENASGGTISPWG
jgi:hypothetical protein